MNHSHFGLWYAVWFLFMSDCINCHGYAKKYEVQSDISHAKTMQQYDIDRCNRDINSLESKVRSLESDVTRLKYKY